MKRILLFAAVALIVSTAGAQMKSKTQCIAEGINPSAVVQNGSKASPSKTTSRRALGPVAQRPQLSPVKLSEVTTTREMKMRDPSTLQRRAPKGPSSDGQPSTFYRRPAGMFSSILFYDKTYKDYFFLIVCSCWRNLTPNTIGRGLPATPTVQQVMAGLLIL